MNEFDWIQEQLGHVQGVRVAQDEPEVVYCWTRQHVVAKVHLDTGTIIWRNVLTTTIDDVLVTKYGIVSLSEKGKQIRVWNASNGHLLRDQVMYSSGTKSVSSVVSASMMALPTERKLIVVASNDGLSFLNVKSMNVVWTWQSLVPLTQLSFVSSSTKQLVYVYGISTGDDPTRFLAEVDHTNEKVRYLEQTLRPLEKQHLLLANPEDGAPIWLTADLHGQEIEIQDLESKTKFTVPLSKTVQTIVQVSSVLFQIQFTDSTTNVYTVSSKDNSELELSLRFTSTSPATVVNHDPASTCFVQAHNDQIKLIMDDHLRTSSTLLAEGLLNHGQIQYVYPVSVNGNQCQLLMIMEDHAMVMMMFDSVELKEVWTREEGLASIELAEWVTPSAPSSSDETILSHIPSFVEALVIQWNELRTFLSSTIMNYDRLFSSTSEEEQLKRSHFFGFYKYILCWTKSGKMYALHSEKKNTIVWSKFIGTSDTSTKMIITRDHPGLGVGPEVMLVSSTKAIWMDADNGKILDERSLVEKDDMISQVIVLPYPQAHAHQEDDADDATSSRRMVGFVSSTSKRISFVPEMSAKIREINAGVWNHFYFYAFENHGLSGYQMNAKTSTVESRWRIQLDPNHECLTIANYPSKETIDSPVVITGDDSLLLKYLNPHLITIVTKSTSVPELEEEPTEELMLERSHVHVMIYDRVSGRLVHRLDHEHATGPVHVVQSENWIMYTYWNEKYQRSEMGSIALYDGALGSRALNLWKRPTWNPQWSSFSTKLPIVLQKNFIFPTHVHVGLVRCMSLIRATDMT